MMKRKIVIAVGIVCLVFIAGGAYIIAGVEMATSKMRYLIGLHQVEIWRKQLLIRIEKVQSDLALSQTPHAATIETVVENVRAMDKIAVSCLNCHHAEEVVTRLIKMIHEIDGYKESLSRFLTMRANQNRIETEYDTAFRIAERLIKDVDNMAIITSAKLSDKTRASFGDISRTKIILYGLIIITPFFAAALGFIFIRELTKPVKTLLEATRTLKGGDLEHRIEGLKGEFGEVAASFNEMSAALKRQMYQIRESEKRHRTLFDSAGDGIVIFEAEGDNPGKIVDANLAAANLYGYGVDELLALRIQDLHVPEDARDLPARIQRILRGEWINEEITCLRKDGTRLSVDVSAGLLEVGHRSLVLSFNRDISYRKKMENAVLQAKLDWEDTFNTITDMITIHDKEFNIIRANKSAGKILGLPSSEIANAKCYAYYHGKESPPEGCPSCQCLVTEKPAAFEIFEPHLNMFLEIRAMPRFDRNNQLIGLIHVMRDITERKRVEKAMQRAEQMKMVGEWAAGLAHEIKNSLAGIKATVELIGGEFDFIEEDRAIVLQAIDEIKRIESLLKSLLSFARPPKPNPTVIDVNEILQKTEAFAVRGPSFSAHRSGGVRTSKDFDQNLPRVLADPMLLQQAFLNLMLNAVEAMPEGGVLGLKTRYDENLKAIEIMISDTGRGIDDETAKSIFQPFFTTKRKGTGLGLAITRRIIEEHGGKISVRSEPGKGALFTILLRVTGDGRGNGS